MRTIKSFIKQNHIFYEPIRFIRAINQEQIYSKLTNFYSQFSSEISDQSLKRKTKRESITTKQLRIFIIVSHDWEFRTLTPILQKDFDTVIFDYYPYSKHLREPNWYIWREKLQKDLIDYFNLTHKQKPYDLVFAYGSYTHFSNSTLNYFHEKGTLVALMWLDDKHTFLPNKKLNYPNGQKPLIGSVDVHLTNSTECINWYSSEGANVLYFPEGCNPLSEDSVKTSKKYDVTFIGKRYGSRTYFINKLKKAGIRVECFGYDWPNGIVPNAEINRIYRQSWINIGFGWVGYSNKITCLKGRDFDIPATGSAYLTTFDPELSKMFNIGKEILCYRNYFDAIEQIRYFLNHKCELQKIGSKALQRCKKEHSWTMRLISVFRYFGYKIDEDQKIL